MNSFRSDSHGRCCSWPLSARGNTTQRPLPKPSQETFAEMERTTQPRVNFFMDKFRSSDYRIPDKASRNSSLLSIVVHD
jgi:hypothetical protein